mgnify:CR=1 FL=1
MRDQDERRGKGLCGLSIPRALNCRGDRREKQTLPLPIIKSPLAVPHRMDVGKRPAAAQLRRLLRCRGGNLLEF